MQTGKLAEAVLKRSVLRPLHKNPAECRMCYGADCTAIPGNTLYAVAGEVPGFAHDPAKILVSAANNLAAAGAAPAAFLLHAQIPEGYEEKMLQQDMKCFQKMAESYHAGIIGGHSEVSDGVLRPLYSITAIGYAEDGCSRQQETLKPGDDLVMTRWIAMGGTAALAIRYEQELKMRFPFQMIDEAKALEQQMAVDKDAAAIFKCTSAAVHDLSQGGIFHGLWEMAERGGVGLEVDLKKIPVKQETIEICEYFDMNPYILYSAGSLLVGVSHGEALAAELGARGIPAAVIGRATDGKDRKIINGEDVRFLDRPRQDEWFRFIKKESVKVGKQQMTSSKNDKQ